uniref:Glutathione S-transferase kappa 1 n=1 Tax=Globodera rostochiensis TaxID=31243 RepID=A0A914I3V1_GLORO
MRFPFRLERSRKGYEYIISRYSPQKGCVGVGIVLGVGRHSEDIVCLFGLDAQCSVGLLESHGLEATLSLYYDIVSPYAWIAFESLSRYERVLDIQLELLPVTFGIMMKALNTVPNVKQSPKKALHLYKDIKLVGNYWNIPINPPKDFDKTFLEKPTRNPQLFLTALTVHCKEFLRPVSREFWHRTWSLDEPFYGWEDIKKICAKLNVPRAEELISASGTDEIKSLLKQRTNEALAQNACGVPWLVLQREGHENVYIWGSDRLPMICELLGKPFRGPLLEQSNL